MTLRIKHNGYCRIKSTDDKNFKKTVCAEFNRLTLSIKDNRICRFQPRTLRNLARHIKRLNVDAGSNGTSVREEI